MTGAGIALWTLLPAPAGSQDLPGKPGKRASGIACRRESAAASLATSRGATRQSIRESEAHAADVFADLTTPLCEEPASHAVKRD